MRIALFGQAAFGRGVLEALLAAGEEVVGVSTPSTRPDPLFEAASQGGIPVIDTPDLRDDEPFQRFAAWQAELLIFAFVTDEVDRRVRDAATHGAIQFHPALLPAHRGSTAMNWTILAGDTHTGVTVFWVDDGVDSGPILLQREVEVAPNDSVGTLFYERLTPIGIEAIVEAVRLISAGTAPREPQDPTQASLEPPCSADHARIDWMQHGRVVGNVIRGCDPQPGALAALRGESLRLYEAEYRPGTHGDPPGTVVAAIDTRVEVAVIGGTIVIGRVQREGQPRIAAAEVVRPGDMLERAP